MATDADFLFVQLPDGTIKGPFEARKVVKTYRAGRVPVGSRVAASREGPWQTVGEFVVAASRDAEEPIVVRPLPSLPARAEPRDSGPEQPARAPDPPGPLEKLSAPVDALPVSTTVPESGPAVGACRSLLERSWRELKGRYWAIVARTIASFAIAGALLALPAVVWLASFLTDRMLDLSDYPWLARILQSTLYIEVIAPFVLVPFGLMFLVCGVLCVLGAVEGSGWSRWGALFAWRRRFLPMMILGYFAAGSEIASFLLTKLVFDQAEQKQGFLSRMLSEGIQACPILVCLIAGMLVMTSESSKGAFVRTIESLKWAFMNLVGGQGTTLALGIAMFFAIACGFLVILLPFLGLPFLFVVIGLGFRGFPRREYAG
jgi:hypothetical protein